MKIYKLKPYTSEKLIKKKYQCEQQLFFPADEEFIDTFNNIALSGESLLKENLVIECEFSDDGMENLPRNDISDIHLVFLGRNMLNEKAMEFFKSQVSDGIEYVPIKYEEEMSYLLYTTNLIECFSLDENNCNADEIIEVAYKSIIFTNKSMKYINKKDLNNYKIFRCGYFEEDLNKIIYSSEVYITEDLKNEIENSGLTGYSFYESTERLR